MNTLILLCILLILVSSVFLVSHFVKSEERESPATEYQGPVPEGYDEKYFRSTGVTKPLEGI